MIPRVLSAVLFILYSGIFRFGWVWVLGLSLLADCWLPGGRRQVSFAVVAESESFHGARMHNIISVFYKVILYVIIAAIQIWVASATGGSAVISSPDGCDGQSDCSSR
jgi:hypothetical protein